MSDAPDRVILSRYVARRCELRGTASDYEPTAVEYIRADIHEAALATARREARDAALEEAAREIAALGASDARLCAHLTAKSRPDAPEAPSLLASIQRHGNRSIAFQDADAVICSLRTQDAPTAASPLGTDTGAPDTTRASTGAPSGGEGL